MIEFVMPKLGAEMTAGTLVTWRKQPGDVVKRGDVIAEVETDKGVIDVEVFASGTLEKLLVPLYQKVPVGTVLAIIREPGEPASTTLSASIPASPSTVAWASSAAAESAPASACAADTSRLRISPSARALARKLGVDPSRIQGTGPAGAITREDVERAMTLQTPSAPAPPRPEPADRGARMRRTIAAAMSRSKREIPHFYLSTTIDMQRAMTWLEDENRKRSVTERLIYGVLLLKAVALALRQTPELNATWDGEQVVQRAAINLGVAIALRKNGLVAPAICDADKLAVPELMAQFRDLVERARAGSLRGSELSEPTITVTSLGEQGVESVFGIINPPQVAIVGFGKPVERPWSIAGQIVSRLVVTATLSADHRVTDGHRGARFLAAIDRLLQEPEKL